MPDSAEQLAVQNLGLTRQLLEWIQAGSHSYAEAMDVWRSSCPRHTIWEDALAAGLIAWDGGREGVLSLTDQGRAMLR